MKFQLTESQEKNLKEWQEKIKDLYGEYGHYDFIFTPFGMITEVKVRSHLAKIEIELTEY